MVYNDNKEFFHDVEYEEINDNNTNQYTLLDVPTTSKLPVSFYFIKIKKKFLDSSVSNC